MINFTFPFTMRFVCDFKNKFSSYFLGTMTMITWSIVVEDSLSKNYVR